MNIQYASDLHINDWPGASFESFLTPVAPIVVIAGDICSAWDPLYDRFLSWISRNWHTVILIAGNHEYYCEPGQPRTIEQTDCHIASLVQKYGNIVFLQNGASYARHGIRFVGATLWSAITPAIWSEIADTKGDHKAIYTQSGLGIRPAHPADICALHASQKSYLRSACVPQSDETLIVVTHHIPTTLLLDEAHRNGRWRSCYASNDEDLFASNIAAWICGHGHRATQLKIPGGPLLLMNARGYNRNSEKNRTTDVYQPNSYFTAHSRVSSM
jgi:3',5'-cyclic AMP phosphodiesterase CpdA